MATVVIPNSRAGVKARTNGYRRETVFSQQMEAKVWIVNTSPAAAGRSKFEKGSPARGYLGSAKRASCGSTTGQSASASSTGH